MEGIRVAFIDEKYIDELNKWKINYLTAKLNGKTYAVVYWYFDTSNNRDIETLDLSMGAIKWLKKVASDIIDL